MYPRGVRAQPIKVVKALETTGQIPQEDIDAKLEAERQKRRARAERFGVEYKEPTIVRLRNSRTTDNTQEELFHEGFVTKKRYYSNVEPVNVTGNLYTNQKVPFSSLCFVLTSFVRRKKRRSPKELDALLLRWTQIQNKRRQSLSPIPNATSLIVRVVSSQLLFLTLIVSLD